MSELKVGDMVVLAKPDQLDARYGHKTGDVAVVTGFSVTAAAFPVKITWLKDADTYCATADQLIKLRKIKKHIKKGAIPA